MADPYFSINPYLQKAAQEKAVGNVGGMSPLTLTSAIQADYSDQATTTKMNQDMALREQQITNQTALANQSIQQSKQLVSASKQSALRQDVSGGVTAAPTLWKAGSWAVDKVSNLGSTTGSTSPGATTGAWQSNTLL